MSLRVALIGLAAAAAMSAAPQTPSTGTISGAVLDEQGKPMPAVMVTIASFNPDTATRGTAVLATTDDRGQYAASVEPGRYIVYVTVNHGSRDGTWTFGRGVPVRAIGDTHIPINLLDAGGRFELTGRADGLIPPPPGADGRPQTYVTTIAPGATEVAAARVIAVGSALTVANVDVRMQRARSPRVAGTIVAPDDPRMFVRLRLVPSGSPSWERPAIQNVTRDRSFAFVRVPEGDYTLEATRSLQLGSDVSGPDPLGLTASMAIKVGGDGLSNVVVIMQPKDGPGGGDRPPILPPAPPASRDTAIIAGVVVDAQRRPVERALVGLTRLDEPFQRTAVSRADGGFEFTGVPAGRFDLGASRPNYANTLFGQQRPGHASTPIRIAAGERATITVTLPPSAIVSGVARHRDGEPAAGATVRIWDRVYRYNRSDLDLIASASTDAQGRYRVAVPAGAHVISLAPTRGRATPGSNAAGTMIMPVYFPGVTELAKAETITVTAGEQRRVDFLLEPVPTTRIDGTIEAPVSGQIQIRRMAVGGDDPLFDASMEWRYLSWRPFAATGSSRFAFDLVPPGRHRIVAQASVSAARGSAPFVLWGIADVTVEEGKPATAKLVLEPGATVSGRLVFEPAATPPPNLRGVSARLEGIDLPFWQLAPNVSAAVGDDGRFTIGGVPPGRYSLVVTGPPVAAWRARSAMVQGRDLLDFPIEIARTDVPDLVVTMSTRQSAITGVVLGRDDRPTAATAVVVFAADRTMWTPHARRTRVVRPDSDGAFAIAELPPGDYFLAVDDVTASEANDASVLARLERAALRISLADGERASQVLKIR